MQTWMIEIMEQFGYLGILIMMAIENLFPPIPSEVILPFGGFMTTYTNLSVLGVIITATTGSVIGAIILYGIGTLIDVSRLERIVDRFGHILRIKKEDVHRADHWFTKYGYWTVLFCRVVPIVRSLISIPAGMSKMTFWLFLLFTMIGTVVWNVILVFFGVILGESWEDILQFMDIYSNIIYLLTGFGLMILLLLYIRKRISEK